MAMKSYFSDPEKMFQLAVSVNAVVTALLPLTLQILSKSQSTMFERIETYEDDAEENLKYAESAEKVATASQWIAILGGKALMFLSGFQAGKGKQNIENKQAKTIVGFQTGFSVLAFAMLFTLCGMGIQVYNSAATWNTKVCEFPAAAPVAASTSLNASSSRGGKRRADTTTAETDTASSAQEAEDKATGVYNMYIGALSVFALLFCVYVWFSVVYGEFSPNKRKSRASAASSAGVTGGSSISAFFTY